VREDLLYRRLFQDDRDDLQLAAAVRAVLQIELKHAFEQSVTPIADSRDPERHGRLRAKGFAEARHP